MRVTSKGQVTIPKHIRQRTGILPGTSVAFTEKNGESSAEEGLAPSLSGQEATRSLKPISRSSREPSTSA